MSNPEKILANSICPDCAEAIDPDLNRCANCGYVHMARLDRTAAVERNPGPARTLACPYCAAVNTIYNETHNVCFSCGRVMYRLSGESPPVEAQTKVAKTTKEKVDSAFKMFLWGVAVLIGLVFFFAVGGIYVLIVVAAVAIPLLVLYGLFLVFGFTFSWISKGRRRP